MININTFSPIKTSPFNQATRNYTKTNNFNNLLKPIVTELLSLARKNGRGEYSYRWLNPLSGNVEN
ncbi:hypothetical protein F0267_28545, partial [Vibrio coralliilyticus]|nr:hypothetical protein [Vibrio coralliilyticus]